MDVILFIVLLLALVWFWFDGTRSRELTIRYCQSFCAQNHVQWLDQSIHQKKIFLTRKNGRIQLRRFYAFEFSIDSTDRYNGVAIECQNKIEYLSLLHPDGEIIHGQVQSNVLGRYG